MFKAKQTKKKISAPGVDENGRPKRAEYIYIEDNLYTLIKKHRDKLFPQYLPLPNRSLLVIEDTNMGIFIDPIIKDAVDAIQTVVSIDTPLESRTDREKENRTVKAIIQLSAFYANYRNTKLSQKEGVFRKQIFGSRAYFSVRTVISSITQAHRYDEMHLPWGAGVALLRLHIQSKLFRRGWSYNDANSHIFGHIQRYDPLIDEIIQELIRETRGGYGLPMLAQRNPSLERGSMQLFYCTKVKTDPSDVTTSFSILNVTGFNAKQLALLLVIIIR